MFKEIGSWFRKDWLNISLALLCAFIPILPDIFTGMQDEMCYIGNNSTNSQNKNEYFFAISQFVISLLGLIIVSFRYKPTAILDISDASPLQDYIENVCHIKQTCDNNSSNAYNVVRSIVKQFYNAWIIIWAIWLLYFGIKIFYYSQIEQIEDCYFFKTNIFGLCALLDFFSSSALFSIYIILNHVTVDIVRRTEKHYSDVYWAFIVLASLLIIIFIFQFFQVSKVYDCGIKDCGIDCGKDYGIFIAVLLSSFGAISFVLVLGKLNSNYLNIPPIFMLLLYVYAVAQSYSFLYLECDKSGKFVHLIRLIDKVLPWIMTIGKIILLITLSWILDKKRLIFYIVHRSLSITTINGELKTFNRYLRL